MANRFAVMLIVGGNAVLSGCGSNGGDGQEGVLQTSPEALYPGPVPRPGGAYTPLFIGNPSDIDTLCNFVRDKSMTTIQRVVSYDLTSSVDVTFNIVRGTSGNDQLVGTDGPDLICGYEGNDTLRGGLGNDVLIGGQGDDTLYGACGQDFLWGGAGNDTIYGESGTSNVCGTTIKAGSPDANNPIFWDLIYGGPGVDTIYAEWGTDAVFGGDYMVDDSVDNINCGSSGQPGGTAYILHPSSGSGWISDNVTGCDIMKVP